MDDKSSDFDGKTGGNSANAEAPTTQFSTQPTASFPVSGQNYGAEQNPAKSEKPKLGLLQSYLAKKSA